MISGHLTYQLLFKFYNLYFQEVPELMQAFYDEDILEIPQPKNQDLKVTLSGFVLNQRKHRFMIQSPFFINQLHELDCTMVAHFSGFVIRQSDFNYLKLQKLKIVIPQFDHSVEQINLPNLREFSAIFTSSATSYDHTQLMKILTHCPKLEKFSITAPMLSTFCNFRKPAEKIPSLKILSLTESRFDFCEKKCAESLINFVSDCPNLEQLWLNNITLTRLQKEAFANKSFALL